MTREAMAEDALSVNRSAVASMPRGSAAKWFSARKKQGRSHASPDHGPDHQGALPRGDAGGKAGCGVGKDVGGRVGRRVTRRVDPDVRHGSVSGLSGLDSPCSRDGRVRYKGESAVGVGLSGLPRGGRIVRSVDRDLGLGHGLARVVSGLDDDARGLRDVDHRTMGTQVFGRSQSEEHDEKPSRRARPWSEGATVHAGWLPRWFSGWLPGWRTDRPGSFVS